VEGEEEPRRHTLKPEVRS